MMETRVKGRNWRRDKNMNIKEIESENEYHKDLQRMIADNRIERYSMQASGWGHGLNGT
jgi:ribosome recycling factor